MLCWALFCVHSSFAIILVGKREMVALLYLSTRCSESCVALPCHATGLVAVYDCGILPDHTHLQFFLLMFNGCTSNISKCAKCECVLLQLESYA